MSISDVLAEELLLMSIVWFTQTPNGPCGIRSMLCRRPRAE